MAENWQFRIGKARKPGGMPIAQNPYLSACAESDIGRNA
jgi:hypothetical protein